MNAVHVDERLGSVAAQSMNGPFDALVEHIVIPRRVPCLTTEDESDGRVKQLQSLGPLPGLFCIVLLGHLLDLPRAPAFITKRPVLDLR
jgi:hypothetical protein